MAEEKVVEKREVAMSKVNAIKALDMLDGVCALVTVNRQDHFNIQGAVKCVKNEILREEEVKGDGKKD